MITRQKFIVITWGSMGDVNPFLGLSAALKSRGHQVTFVTNEIFREMAVELGLDFHPIGTMDDAETILNNPDLWHPRKGFEIVWRSCLATQKLIADFIIKQPDATSTVVIAHPLALPGAVTARDALPGLRLAGTYLAPANLRTCHDPLFIGPLHIPSCVPMAIRRWLWRRVDAGILDPLTLPDINALRRTYGLAPVSHYADLIYAAPDFSITLFPEWFGPTMPDWPQYLLCGEFMLFEGMASQPLDAELEAFLADGDAPIVFTFGSAMKHADKAFQVSVNACQRLERRGILLTMFGEQIPANLPPTIKWLEYAPFGRLLPHAAAVVHHGGIGSTAEAMRAGIPQVVVPMAHDQFDNGARVEALGIGISLARHHYRAGTLARKLSRLLHSGAIGINCREAVARFDLLDPAIRVCRLIEEKLDQLH